MTHRHFFTLFLAVFILAACGQGGEEGDGEETAVSPPSSTTQPAIIATPLSREEWLERIPALAEREAAFAEVLASDQPVLTLPDDELTDPQQQIAQQLALQDPDFQTNYFHPLTGDPLRNEIMTVRAAVPADFTDKTRACEQSTCYRVEMYNYPFDMGIIAIVDVENQSVLDVSQHGSAQPDLNQRLIDLAVQIAINAPEVQAELGIEPNAEEATMPATKTALNGSRCERSHHLCVAPTFLVDDRALFAIVDLTDELLVGARWTEMGASGAVEGIQVTERIIQNDAIMSNYCERANPLVRDDWEMSYVLTPSDGLQINDVRYQGELALSSAKLVDWHVSYSEREGFGYSDAIGCPEFSPASIIAFNAPFVEDIVDESGQTIGFALIQDFLSEGWPRPCYYRYQQRYEFYEDGRFRIIGGNYGRGCGNDGIYRPVYRIDIAASEDGTQDSFAEWSGSDWATWETEQWQQQTDATAYTDEGYQYRITAPDGSGYYFEPGQGQFDDGGRGDNAFTYVTRRDPDIDEGDSDMITIGSCCNADYQQGPEKYIDPAEPIVEADLVIWYVGRMENDDTPGSEYCWADMTVVDGDFTVDAWPCFYGPMFVPIENSD